MLERGAFEALARERGSALITLCLPTHRYGREVEGDPTRLKNLLGESVERARESGRDESQVEAAIEPARELLSDREFWQHQGDGLALFFAPSEARLYRLPQTVEELAYVGERFCLRPLLPVVGRGQTFYVLALSQKSVRLLACNRGGAREIDLRDIPESLGDAVGYDWEQRSLQFHTGAPRTGAGQRAGIFHGQGGGTEESKDEIARFLRRVDAGLNKLIKDRSAPLVVAAVDYVIAIYHQVSHYPELVSGGCPGNPEHLDVEELHALALERVSHRLDAVRRSRLERLESLKGTDRVANGIREVLDAALDGRARTMFVPSDRPLWGRFDEASREAVVHEERRSTDDDLHDLAMAYALASGAEVFRRNGGADGEEEPGSIAAILRY